MRTTVALTFLLAGWVILATEVFSLGAATPVTSLPAAPPRPFVVFGYLPEYRQSQFAYDDYFALGLTHLIFFSVEVDGATGMLLHADSRLPGGDAWRAIRASADAHRVQLMLCVGGGGRSAGFAAMVADPLRRVRFVEELNALLLERRMDGVDINWEYPQGREQWEAFAHLIREMKSALGYVRVRDPVGERPAGREDATSMPHAASSPGLSEDHVAGEGGRAEQDRLFALWQEQRWERWAPIEDRRPHGRAAGDAGRARRPPARRVRLRDMTVSMAIHPHPQIAGLLRDLGILPWLDYLHLMAYDHMQPREAHSSLAYARLVLSHAYISALALDTRHPPPRTRSGPTPDTQLSEAGEVRDASGGVSTMGSGRSRPPTERGVLAGDHRRKLTLGIPFYGRHVEDGRLEPETYARLQYFIAQWASKHRPGWRLDGTGEEVKIKNNYTGYAFDSYRDVQAKMRLARRSGPAGGIAGIMLWELGQDMQPPLRQPLSLMRAVGEQLARWNVSTRPVPASPGSESVDYGDL